MIYAPDGKRVLETFTFGRQTDAPGPMPGRLRRARARRDASTTSLCSSTTIGPGVRALAEEWKDKGEYLRSHILQVLALEGAEAFAELLHQKIREMWGFRRSRRDSRKKDLFQAHYHGKRFSLRLSGLSAPGRSGADFPPARRRRNKHRRAPDRGLHDGSRGRQ